LHSLPGIDEDDLRHQVCFVNEESVMGFTTVSELADKLGVRPRDISDALYQRRVDVSCIPLVSGRRVIPREQIPAIRRALEATGRLRSK
jgi:hypothetical protein